MRANACIPFLGGGIQAMQSEGQCEEGTFLLSFLPSYFFLFSSEAKSQLDDKWSDESYTLPTFCVSALKETAT